jgi:hypothetical protein
MADGAACDVFDGSTNNNGYSLIPGGPSDHSNCGPSSYCDPTGICKAQNTATAGTWIRAQQIDTTSGMTIACTTGLFGYMVNGQNQCTAPVAVGASCTYDLNCVSKFCSQSTGKCVAANSIANYASCTLTAAAVSATTTQCLTNSLCGKDNSGARICLPSTSTVGGACTYDWQCPALSMNSFTDFTGGSHACSGAVNGKNTNGNCGATVIGVACTPDVGCTGMMNSQPFDSASVYCACATSGYTCQLQTTSTACATTNAAATLAAGNRAGSISAMAVVGSSDDKTAWAKYMCCLACSGSAFASGAVTAAAYVQGQTDRLPNCGTFAQTTDSSGTGTTGRCAPSRTAPPTAAGVFSTCVNPNAAGVVVPSLALLLSVIAVLALLL